MAFLCAARWVGEVFLVLVRLCTGPRSKTRCEAIGGGARVFGWGWLGWGELCSFPPHPLLLLLLIGLTLADLG